MARTTRWPVPLLLAAALASGCGKGANGEGGGTAPPSGTLPAKTAPAAPAKPDPAEVARREAKEREAREARAVEDGLARVRRLGEAGKFEEARAALGEVLALPGADPARVDAAREALKAREEEAVRTGKRRDLLRAFGSPVPSEDPAERAEVFENLVRAAEEFLARWPEDAEEAEIRAGLDYARREGRKNRDYLEALARARAALEAKRWEDAVEAADAAWNALPREEARTLRVEAVRGAAPEGMVLVPEGPALLGHYRKSTVLPSFYIDKTEVTCKEYARFLAATGRAGPPDWSLGIPPASRADHPMVNVTGDEAAAYAAWAGKRLPTEQEWEKAARGPEGRIYPWGDEWDRTRGNFGRGGTVRAGDNPGDFSWYGVLDMGGNAAEFTTPVLPFQGPGPLDDPAKKPKWVVKGGRWGQEDPKLSALHLRYPFRADEKDAATGFRCVKDAR